MPCCVSEYCVLDSMCHFTPQRICRLGFKGHHVIKRTTGTSCFGKRENVQKRSDHIKRNNAYQVIRHTIGLTSFAKRENEEVK